MVKFFFFFENEMVKVWSVKTRANFFLIEEMTVQLFSLTLLVGNNLI